MSDEIDIYVGRIAVPDAAYLSWQGWVDTLFAEVDFIRRPRKTAHKVVRDVTDGYLIDDEPEFYRYFLVPAAVIRKRLLIQGYTRDFCAQAWDAARRRIVDTYRQHVTIEDGEMAQGLALLDSVSLADWFALIRNLVQANPKRTIAGRQQPWHFLSLLDGPYDTHVQLALLADALPDAPVWMDCTPLFHDPKDMRTPQQLAQQQDEGFDDFPSGKIIVLTEGKSDTRIITSALRAFYPELADAYQFLDFEEFNIEGGASLLARMVKVLSGARVKNRMVALFDNDAAGVEAYRSLHATRFPQNVRLMTLPDTKLAESYPTLGPGGLARMNVNGAGAPIELYMGRTSLRDAVGTLRPVRWAEWKDRIGCYHGVVQDKGAVAQAFDDALRAATSPAALRRKFPEMDLLLRSIFAAFEELTPPSLEERLA